MIEETELLRARWHRQRERQRLIATDDAQFGIGGLAAILDRPAVRLLVLPADPECSCVEFDDDFWAWYCVDLEDPVSGDRSNWGSACRPTANAAVRTDARRELAGRYIAVMRHGGLELGLGREAVYAVRDTVECFGLLTIVGRIWCALEQYRGVIQRFKVAGPWQVTLALLQTEGRVLGNVATGWQDPIQFGDALVCRERNLVHVVEVCEWPDAKGTEQLAYRLGARIEDSWGYKSRRFIARQGSAEGRFDRTRYGW